LCIAYFKERCYVFYLMLTDVEIALEYMPPAYWQLRPHCTQSGFWFQRVVNCCRWVSFTFDTGKKKGLIEFWTVKHCGVFCSVRGGTLQSGIVPSSAFGGNFSENTITKFENFDLAQYTISNLLSVYWANTWAEQIFASTCWSYTCAEHILSYVVPYSISRGALYVTL